MALADWEVILGGDLQLDTTYKVSGAKSLSQAFDGGATHIVHSATYNDAPKNVEIRTWMTVLDPDDYYYDYFIGCIARKQKDVNTYFYWLLRLRINYQGLVTEAEGTAGYYSDGTQNQVDVTDILNDFKAKLGDYWNSGKWRFVRLIGYESEGKFNVIIEMTPDIDTPDVNNPPLDQLQSLYSVVMDIPTELQNGGACGLIVGGVKPSTSYAKSAKPFYDYTQIYY